MSEFREKANTRACRHCKARFVTGSLRGTRYCSLDCRKAERRKRDKANGKAAENTRRWRAKMQREARKSPFVGKGQDSPAAERRPIPPEVLALGSVRVRRLGRDGLMAEVRRLTAGLDWWDELLEEWGQLAGGPSLQELRAAVLLLGGEIEVADEHKEGA